MDDEDKVDSNEKRSKKNRKRSKKNNMKEAKENVEKKGNDENIQRKDDNENIERKENINAEADKKEQIGNNKEELKINNGNDSTTVNEDGGKINKEIVNKTDKKKKNKKKEKNVKEKDTMNYDDFMARDLLWTKEKQPPYKIVYDEHVGRHLIATRAIRAGEVIMLEQAIITAPADVPENNDLWACTNCLRNNVRLDDCEQQDASGLPLCPREGCRKKESNLIRGLPKSLLTKASRLAETREALGSLVAVMNALELKESKDFNIIMSLMSHKKERRESRFWSKKTQNVLQLTEQYCSGVDKELVETILGIMQVNQFEVILKSELELRALFGLASIPSHECVTNTRHRFIRRKDKLLMEVVATTDMKEGEEITHSYAEPLMPLLARKEFLQIGKFFTCECRRCKDATELGTDASAIFCTDCKNKGIFRPTMPQDMNSVWKCDLCCKDIRAKDVKSIYQDAKNEYENIGEQSIPSLTSLLKSPKLALLSDQHVLKMDIRYNLARMYGHVEGFEPQALSEQQLDLKIDLCTRVLKVLDKLEPGLQRRRGIMLYELHMPLVIRSQRLLQRKRLFKKEKSQIKADLKLALSALEEALIILGMEKKESFERTIADASSNAVVELKAFVSSINANLK